MKIIERRHTMNNPRKNRPSLSGLKALAECPRKFQLEQMCFEEKQDYTNHGDFLHDTTTKLLSLKQMDNFNGRQQFDTFLNKDQEAVKSNIERFTKHITENKIELTEKNFFQENRLWLYTICSGQPDCYYIYEQGKKADLWEWKYGSQPVPSVYNNLQTAGYSALLFHHYPTLQEVHIRLCAPLAMGERFSEGIIKREGIEEITNQIVDICLQAMSANPPYASKIGDCCQFCKATGICALHKQETSIVEHFNTTVSEKTYEITTENYQQVYENLQKIENSVKFAGNACKKIRSGLMAFIKGNEGLELSLSPKLGNKSYDVLKTFEFLNSEYGITADEFLPACKIGVEAVREVLAKKADMKTSKAKKVLEDNSDLWTQEVSSYKIVESNKQIEGESK